jgi:hypothetical protein
MKNQHKIVNSNLGKMGRFANKAFQYIFLLTYSTKYGYEFSNLQWEGDEIFNIQPGVSTLPKMNFTAKQTDIDPLKCAIANASEPLKNHDLQGYFQYNMKYYLPYRKKITAEFAAKGIYLNAENTLQKIFKSLPGPVAVIHLRRGDYGQDVFFITPNSWYLNWLKTLRKKYPNLHVFIATDDYMAIDNVFDEFNIMTTKSLDLPSVDHNFFYDFCAMKIADHLAIANSTFSFLASILNTNAKTFVRPDPSIKKLKAYNPWISDPLILTHKAEDLGEEYKSEYYRSNKKYNIQKILEKIFTKISSYIS